MAWDTSRPADSERRRDYPALARADKQTLFTDFGVEHEALGTGTGKHKSITLNSVQPSIIFQGTEAGAKQFLMRISSNQFELYRNDGTPAAPVWAVLFYIQADGTVVFQQNIVPAGSLRCDWHPGARLVIPVGIDKYATG